jgi:UDP-N-acetylmuramoyl-tripeptide--D-alanyl-D-alanine ligase
MEELYQLFRNASGVCIDTRKLEPGQLFFALRGPNFDANQFVQKALDMGAHAAVADDPVVAENNPRIFLVSDVLKSMQKLANYHRKNYKGPVLALTGSNGKTTTKELISAVLRQKFKVHATIGNYNNLIGLPYTILSMKDDTEFLLLEMGANAPGEIAELCRIAEPDLGLITNIGKAHLEGFGSIEGVVRAKCELYDHLASINGTAFVNLAEKHLEENSRNIQNRIFYSSEQENYGHSLVVKSALLSHYPVLEIKFSLGEGKTEQIVKSRLTGTYNYPNIATAIATGAYFAIDPQKIASGISAYEPKNNRSEVVKKDSNTVFLDAYNANPSSMKASVSYFLEHFPPPRFLILGDMLELGADSDREHQWLIDELLLKRDQFSHLWLVGEEFSRIKTTAFIRHFRTVEEAKDAFEKLGFENYSLMLKGSRGIGLERFVNPLKRV